MIHTRHTRSGIRYDVRVGHGAPQRSFTRKKDAEEYEAELVRARKRGRAGLETVKPDVTFNQLVQLWRDNYSPSAWRLHMVSYAQDKWGNVQVRAIQPEAVGAWIGKVTGKSDRPLSEKTRAHILESFRHVLNAGVEWGYLLRSPARPGAFKTPRKNSRVKPIQPFESWEEVEQVAAACRRMNRTAQSLVIFACATGLRCPGELAALRWNQIDLKARIVRVGSKTDAGHRTVPLSEKAVVALLWQPRSISGYVFPGKRPGEPFNYEHWRRYEWPLALEACGFPHRPPYEMRHTFATLALAHGASIDDVATVMGHDDITVAFRYYRKWIKLGADRLRLTLDQIGATDDDHRSAAVRNA